MAKRATVPVTERALIQRINRKLQHNDQMIKTARGERVLSELGRHYTIDFRRNALVWKDVDVEALGRELGALRAYEHVAD